MKNTLKTILAVAALGAASAAHAISMTGSVTLTNTPIDGDPAVQVNGGGLGGGEFKAVSGSRTFYTFCLEHDQSIYLPGTYDYALSNMTDHQSDVISKATAYLYSAFVRGDLYVQGVDDHAAGLLQAAFWYFEGEVDNTWSYWADWVVGNTYIAQAVGGIVGNAFDDYTGDNVMVMNLTKGRDHYQDVLVYVPDSGSTLALLGLGILGLAAVRRRR